MPRSLIMYFSMGGTTARVANSIAVGLRVTGWGVALHNFKDGEAPGLDGCDLLGIGTPTYYFRPPFNVMDYVNSLPSLDGLPVFVFVLHGTYLGDAGDIARRAFFTALDRPAGPFPPTLARYPGSGGTIP